MIRYLKKGISQEELVLSNQQIKETVENILADIESRGDEAIREYSEKFDKWTPKVLQNVSLTWIVLTD